MNKTDDHSSLRLVPQSRSSPARLAGLRPRWHLSRTMVTRAPSFWLLLALGSCGGEAVRAPDEADAGLDGRGEAAREDAAEDGTVADGMVPEDAGLEGSRVDGGCGPDTCAYGCCGPHGLPSPVTCYPQPDNFECGSHGGPCDTCMAPYECVSRACVYAQPACSGSTCGPGCCLGGGSCSDGLSVSGCGAHGDQCSQCVGGEVCNAMDGGGGSCGPPPPPQCGPENCQGCCLALAQGMVCATGNQQDACGVGGAGCRICEPGAMCTAEGMCE